MLTRYIKPILLVTGLITLSPLIKFLFPDSTLVPGVEVVGETGRFIARHQALEIACIGGLLVYAAFHAATRLPVLVAAIVGKGGMVYLLLRELGNPAFDVMKGTLAFDAVCVVLYALCLLQARGETTT